MKITLQDLLIDAPEWFKEIVNKLETEQNLGTRAKIAEEFIESHQLTKDIKMECLGLMLAYPKYFPISWWREVYLIERSSKPRNSKLLWFDRLIIFYNTWVHETNIVVNAVAPNGAKFYFIKGNAAHPTYHDVLHAGRGENKADFYFYDDTLPGTEPWQKMVKVEHKYCYQDTVEEAAKYYKDNHSYNARYLTLYKENAGYFIYDYQTNTYKQLANLIKPTNLVNL